MAAGLGQKLKDYFSMKNVEDGYDEAYSQYMDHGYDEEAEVTHLHPMQTMEPDLRRIVTVRPTTYNEARVVGEAFRDGTPVIMNLESMPEAEAKRMVDFAAGLVFGIAGVMERVTNRVFLLSPAHVEVEIGSELAR